MNDIVSAVLCIFLFQYEDSMIMKIFVFQFVNSYASFFYLAFVAEWRGECPESGCMSTLAINLAIIFGSRLVSGNILELLIPYLSYQYKYKAEMAKSEGKISRPEREFLLDPVSLFVVSVCFSFINISLCPYSMTWLPPVWRTMPRLPSSSDTLPSSSLLCPLLLLSR